MLLDTPLFIVLGFLVLCLSALFYAFIFNKCEVYRRRETRFHPVNGVGMRALQGTAGELEVAEEAEERQDGE